MHSVKIRKKKANRKGPGSFLQDLFYLRIFLLQNSVKKKKKVCAFFFFFTVYFYFYVSLMYVTLKCCPLPTVKLSQL